METMVYVAYITQLYNIRSPMTVRSSDIDDIALMFIDYLALVPL
jgi:hypothetical protein